MGNCPLFRKSLKFGHRKCLFLGMVLLFFFPKTLIVVFTEEGRLKFIEAMKIKFKDC